MIKGKTIVVTGAAGGIGTCLVKRLSQHNVVHAWDLNLEALEKLRMESKATGEPIEIRQVDVTKREELKQGRNDILSSRRQIDIWINNAGIADVGELLDVSPEKMDRAVDVNVRAVIHGTRLALEHMETAGTGSIVNIASVAGHLPAPFLAVYTGTKHAVVGFTRALRTELKLRMSKVDLCLVSPGFVDTTLLQNHPRIGFPEWLRWSLASPDDVAREIIKGIEKRKSEVFPTANGRLMLKVHKVVPGLIAPGAKVLLTKNWKDVFLKRYQH